MGVATSVASDAAKVSKPGRASVVVGGRRIPATVEAVAHAAAQRRIAREVRRDG